MQGCRKVNEIGVRLLFLISTTWSLFGATGFYPSVEPTGSEEQMRWLINRARFSPQQENQRLGTNYQVPDGPLPPLAPATELVVASRKHSEDLSLAENAEDIQHQTPVDSPNFPAGSLPHERVLSEGFVPFGVGENIAAGQLSISEAHDDFFESSEHRVVLLNELYLDIGVGYLEDLNTLYKRHYTVKFGVRDGTSEHFFTGTLFNDADSNLQYDDTEAVAGIEVTLIVNGAEHDSYNVSNASGGFTIPISDIADGSRVAVQLENTGGGSVTLTIPTDYETFEVVGLTAGESVVFGEFTQPSGRVNVGLRNVSPGSGQPLIDLGATRVDLTFPTEAGLVYTLYYSTDLKTWTPLETKQAEAALTVFTDATVPPTYPGLKRFYNVKLATE